MNSGPLAAFVTDLREMQLLTPAQLQEIDRGPLTRIAEPRLLARELIQRNWLTPYQVNQLLQGHGKELVLGPYRILDRLGEGPASKVFKARHLSGERTFAVKLLPKALIASLDAADSFARSVTRLQSLKAPFLANFCDAPVIGDNLVIVSEFLDGLDLARLVQKSGPLPVVKALDYVRQIAAALQFLHQAGLAHRNVKPSNLLLCQPPNGAPESVKLLDLAQAPFTAGGDIRADLYGLGGTLFFLLTGRMPLANSSITQWRSDVPPPAQAALGKLLAKRPEDRFQTPAELLAALSSAAPPPDKTMLGNLIDRSPAIPSSDKTMLGNLVAPTLAAGSENTMLGNLIGQARSAPPIDKTMLGSLIAPTPPKTLTDKTMLGNLIEQTQTPPKAATEKTMLGNLIDLTARPPSSEETLLGEFVGRLPATGQEDGPVPVWLGTAKRLPTAGDSGIVKKGLMVLSAICGAGIAAAIILGAPSLIKAPSGEELAVSTRRPLTSANQPSPALVLKSDPKPTQPVPKTKLTPTPQLAPKSEPKIESKIELPSPDPKPNLTPEPEPKQKMPKTPAPDTKTNAEANPKELIATLKGHRGPGVYPVTLLAFSPDGKTLASAGGDGVRLWQIPSGKEICQLKTGTVTFNDRIRPRPAISMAFSPDGKKLATTVGELIQVWDLFLQTELYRREKPALAIGFANKGEWFVTASSKAIRLFSTASGGQIQLFDGALEGARIASFTQGGRIMAVGGDSATIRLYDVFTGKQLRELDGLATTSMAFAQDGKTLAGARGARIELRDTATGRRLHQLEGHERSVIAMAFSPDGRTLASASGHEKGIRIWDVTTGKESYQLVQSIPTLSLAFAPDGKTMASGHPDGKIKLWRVAPPSPKSVDQARP